MLHLNKKWLPAVLLAVVLHIIVFTIAYSALKPQPSSHATQHMSPNPIADPPLTTAAATQTMTITETHQSNPAHTDPPITDDNATTQISAQTQTAAAQPAAHKHDQPKEIAVDNSNTASKAKPRAQVSVQKNAAQTVAERPEVPHPQADGNTSPEAVLEKNDIGLLAGDVAMKKDVADETYQAVKSEAEGINDQLRAAINEIKHRNQSKIEQAQPPKASLQADHVDASARTSTNNEADNETNNGKDRADDDAPMTAP